MAGRIAYSSRNSGRIILLCPARAAEGARPARPVPETLRGVAGSDTPPSAPRSARDRRPPEGSKIPDARRAKPLNTDSGRPATLRRPGWRAHLEGKSGRMERTCLPHTNTSEHLTQFDPNPKQQSARQPSSRMTGRVSTGSDSDRQPYARAAGHVSTERTGGFAACYYSATQIWASTTSAGTLQTASSALTSPLVRDRAHTITPPAASACQRRSQPAPKNSL